MLRLRIMAVFVALFLVQIGLVSGGNPEPDPVGLESFSFVTGIDGVHQSQIVLAPDGTMLLVWVQKAEEEFDLFVATRTGAGGFSVPLLVSRAPVNSYTGDEARPDVALGPDGAVAIVWTSEDMNMMVAVSKDHGRSFAAPMRMNQDDGHAARTMPVAAFSSDGAVHAIWLDARGAPPGREEPANLYYARIEDGGVKENNLTANQKASVCGCCRPFIAIDNGNDIQIAFRNTTEEGYRDIYLIEGRAKGKYGKPHPASPPIWEIGGCPSVGPVVLHGLTLWKDGSEGFWRLLSASDPGAEPAVILKDLDDQLTLTYAPRRVSGSEDLVLVGGRPGGFILKRHDSGWDVVKDDLPEWASSAALHEGWLVLIGNDEGRLRVETMRLEGTDGQVS